MYSELSTGIDVSHGDESQESYDKYQAIAELDRMMTDLNASQPMIPNEEQPTESYAQPDCSDSSDSDKSNDVCDKSNDMDSFMALRDELCSTTLPQLYIYARSRFGYLFTTQEKGKKPKNTLINDILRMMHPALAEKYPVMNKSRRASKPRTQRSDGDSSDDDSYPELARNSAIQRYATRTDVSTHHNPTLYEQLSDSLNKMKLVHIRRVAKDRGIKTHIYNNKTKKTHTKCSGELIHEILANFIEQGQ